MEYRQLGNSGLMVSELGLGGMMFGEPGEQGTPPDEAERIIHRFLDVGGNHIDTANVYAEGQSEGIIGQAIKDRRDQVIVATKVRFSMGQGPNDRGLSRHNIMRSVEGSLRRLQTETVDLLYMHLWDAITPLHESLRAFDDLVTAGKARYVGVSNFKAWQVMKALSLSDAHGWVRFVAAQYQYSLVVRDIEDEFADLCLAEGLGIVPWGPLGGGFLSGKYQRGKRPIAGRIAFKRDELEGAWHRRATERNWRILDAVEEIGRAHEDATCSQVALAWLLAQPAVASVLVGARTMAQLEENLGAAHLRLAPEDITRLNNVSTPAEAYPYRMIRRYEGL